MAGIHSDRFVQQLPDDTHQIGADLNIELQLLPLSHYPDMLILEPGPMGEPGTGFTYRVGANGWFSLLDKLCQDVMAVNRRQGLGGLACRITDIKEKMRQLRIACEGATEQIEALIKEVRLEAARNCRVSGSFGTLHVLPGNVAANLCGGGLCRVVGPKSRSGPTLGPTRIGVIQDQLEQAFGEGP